MEGWFKKHRKILKWEWYKDVPVRVLFDHLLITVQFEDYRYKGIALKPGQRLFGRLELAEECGLTEQQVRTALTKLKSTNEITIESTNRGSLLTIVNWIEYQSNQDSSTSKSTNEITTEQPSINQASTTNKEEKNEKKEGESRTRTYTCEAPPPPPVEYKIINKESETPKISRSLIVNLLKRQERGEKLSEEDQEILKNDRKSQGFQEPQKPPEDPYLLAKSLIWQRDKLGRGHVFTASQIAEIAKYESLHNNNRLNGARVG